MKWNDDEMIMAWGYYLENNNKVTGNKYLKIRELFRRLQNRDPNNAASTFKMKLMNIDGFMKNNKKTSSNIEKSNLYKSVIEKMSEEEIIFKYRKLIEDFDEIQLNEEDKISDHKFKFDIDIQDEKNFGNAVAKVSYSNFNLSEYLVNIKNGSYKVPLFQREFTWTKKQIISFLNAINVGYPFGNITIWKSEQKGILSERNKFIKEYRKSNDNFHMDEKWILDGQQRTTSIVSQLINIKGLQKNKNIIFSLNTNEFKEKDNNDNNYIEARDIIDNDILATSIRDKYDMTLENATAITQNLRMKILGTKIGVTTVETKSLNTAIDIFTEMNTKGTKLSLFNIVHAKWQSDEIDFNLEDFINNWLKDSKYQVEKTAIVKAIYLCLDKDNISSNNIMQFKIPINIRPVMKKIETSLNMAHDFLTSDMGFKSELMPSTNLIKIMTYMFHKNNNCSLTEKQRQMTKSLIKYICLTNMYSSSTNQKIKNNINNIDSILVNNTFIDEIENVNLDQDSLKQIKYQEGSSTYYYILNMLFKNAKSFKNNDKIPPNAKNNNSSKINIHHIFPKSLKINDKKVENIDWGNSILNLTPILEDENKKISKKYPAKYYEDYKKVNEKLDETLKDVFINPEFLKEMGGNTSEELMNEFFNDRAKKILDAINS